MFDGNSDGIGKLLYQFGTNALAEIQVTYDYPALTTVPEPASMALLALGLAGLASVRRRK